MTESALLWIDACCVTGLPKTKSPEGKTDDVPDLSSKDECWTRFYVPQTGRPMFVEAQDGIVCPTFWGVAAKNKAACDLFTTKHADSPPRRLCGGRCAWTAGSALLGVMATRF